jgi:DNA repair exonuclease SbcCD ATPase subunit
MQQSLEERLLERDSHTSQLEALLGSRDAALQQLTEQLQAYQGLSPDAAAALQTENTALAAAKRAAAAAAAEADQRAEDAGRRVHQGVATWERLQADLQGENGRLAAVLQRQQHELAALFQEKEVLRARTAMLETRTAAAPGLLQPPSPASPCNSTQAADAATQLAAHQAAEAVELRQRLTDAQQRVEEREATARKYRVGGKRWRSSTAVLGNRVFLQAPLWAVAVQCSR